MALGRADIVSLLLSLRGTPTGEVEMALRFGQLCNFEALLWNGWDINAPILPTGPTALGHVVHDITLTKWFLEHGADPNGGYQYETAFSCAAQLGSTEVIEMFLDRGADVLRGDVLFFAMGRRENAVEVANLLLSRGADPNRLRFDGLEPGWSVIGLHDGLGTPLHSAIRQHRLDIVIALVKAGADLDVQDTLGRTPRMLAELRHNTEMLVLLDAHK
jgi:ankyrin repeat protein